MKSKLIKVRFDKYSHQTLLAYCVWFRNKQIYLPKKLCFGFGVFGNDLHVWVRIPEWLYREKTGEEPPEEKYHIPRLINPIKTEPDKDLLDD